MLHKQLCEWALYPNIPISSVQFSKYIIQPVIHKC